MQTQPTLAGSITRRRLISGVGAGVSLFGVPHGHLRADASVRKDPFTLGVASGDPLANAVVIWTRLAPEPLDPDGGLGPRAQPVEWQVATDEQMTKVVHSGVVRTGADSAHSVHVDVTGLAPAETYFYRFRCGRHVSPVGRTRTAPAPRSRPEQIRFAHASCQNYTAGHFTAHPHLADEDLDFVVWLGDYIYDTPGKPIPGRTHRPPYSVRSLEDFRTRHTQYKLEAGLQAAHAAHPWIITLDDHDVINNLCTFRVGGHPEMDEAYVAGLRQRAFQAAYEHLPIRRRPRGAYYDLYRGYDFGDLVALSILDQRQYRSFREPQCAEDDQDPSGYCPADLDPDRTSMGREQTAWLLRRLRRSRVHWNVLGSPMIFTQKDRNPEPGSVQWNRDAVVERQQICDVIRSQGIANVVLVAGDSHANFVFNTPPRFDGDLTAPPIATEFDGTSMTSGGDRADREEYFPDPENNPHQMFYNNAHGYTVCEARRDRLTATFRAVSTVEATTASVRTLCTWSVASGSPGAELISRGG